MLKLKFWKLRKRKRMPRMIKTAGEAPVSARRRIVMVNGFMCTTLPMNK